MAGGRGQARGRPVRARTRRAVPRALPRAPVRGDRVRAERLRPGRRELLRVRPGHAAPRDRPAARTEGRDRPRRLDAPGGTAVPRRAGDPRRAGLRRARRLRTPPAPVRGQPRVPRGALRQGPGVLGPVARRSPRRDHRARGPPVLHGRPVPPRAAVAADATTPAVPRVRRRREDARRGGIRADGRAARLGSTRSAGGDGDVERSQTRYARSGDVSIAYQVVGDGPFDLVYVPGFVSNIELMWEEPGLARFLERLASFSRLILFDKRGTGLSDPVPTDGSPTLEERMDDVRAVMDAVGSERAALLGHSEGGNMCVLFTATYPERTTALLLVGCYAKRLRSQDYPWAPTVEARTREIDETEPTWASPEAFRALAPSKTKDQAFQRWIGRYLRQSASPKAAAALMRMNTKIDVRDVLPTIGVPTLLLYRTHA